MAAAQAAELKIHAHPKDRPLLTAAGVGLFHFQGVPHTNVHIPPPLSCQFNLSRRI